MHPRMRRGTDTVHMCPTHLPNYAEHFENQTIQQLKEMRTVNTFWNVGLILNEQEELMW